MKDSCGSWLHTATTSSDSSASCSTPDRVPRTSTVCDESLIKRPAITHNTTLARTFTISTWMNYRYLTTASILFCFYFWNSSNNWNSHNSLICSGRKLQLRLFAAVTYSCASSRCLTSSCGRQSNNKLRVALYWSTAWNNILHANINAKVTGLTWLGFQYNLHQNKLFFNKWPTRFCQLITAAIQGSAFFEKQTKNTAGLEAIQIVLYWGYGNNADSCMWDVSFNNLCSLRFEPACTQKERHYKVLANLKGENIKTSRLTMLNRVTIPISYHETIYARMYVIEG